MEIPNKVTVVGLLSENNVEIRQKDGRNYISGNFKVQVANDSIIQINVFSYELTKDGKVNPAYVSIKNLKEKGISLASVNGDASRASKIRMNNGRLEENLFVSRITGKLISGLRISGSFFNVGGIIEENKATFLNTIYITNIREETNLIGELTGRLIVDGAIKQYNRYDVLPFIVETPKSIEYVTQHWSKGDTVSISGKIVNKTVREEIPVEEVFDGGFGEPDEEVRTSSKTELIITAGGEPKDEEFALPEEEVKNGLIDRQRRIDEQVEKAQSQFSIESDF